MHNDVLSVYLKISCFLYFRFSVTTASTEIHTAIEDSKPAMSTTVDNFASTTAIVSVSSRSLPTTSATVLRHTQQPQMTTDYIMARNLASNPPGDVLQLQRHCTWTEIQPTNLHHILSDQLQPTAHSTPVCSGTQTPTTTTSTSTDTAAVLSSAFQTLNSNTSLNSAFNLSDYMTATPKGPTSTTDAQWTPSKRNIQSSLTLQAKCFLICVTCKLFFLCHW